MEEKRNDKNNETSEVQKTIASIETAVEEAVSKTSAGVKAAADKVSEKGAKAKAQVKKKASSAKETVTTKASKAKETVTTKASKAKETVKKNVSSGKEKAKATVAKISASQETYFEIAGEQILMEDINERIREAWLAEGHHAGRLKSIKTYLNIEERRAYYVINGKAENKFVEF
ncbi:MAG: DUF6465 family protein [Lachnospiraceae bacterium]|nr:DUF6465 family protein [Lachnospiraceae bacterium]